CGIYTYSVSFFCPVFFYHLIWHPTRDPLFPYTTLFRSCSDRTRSSAARSRGWCRCCARCGTAPAACRRRPGPSSRRHAAGAVPRSEEHTSELQSRFDLVCRLLLDKKITNRTTRTSKLLQ